MYLLADAYSDYGGIDETLSTQAYQGMSISNVQKQYGTPFRSASASTTFTIVGALNNSYGTSAALYTNAVVLAIHNLPVNSTVKFEAIASPIASPLVTYSQTKVITRVSKAFWMLLNQPVLTDYYRLTITVPVAQVLQVYRMLVGYAWKPNFNYSNSIKLQQAVSNNSTQKLRNGGTRVLPAIPYRQLGIKIEALSPSVIGQFQDIVYQYSKHTDMAIILEDTESLYAHTTNFLGRLTEWSDPVKSLKGYEISFTFEEV